MEADVPSTSEHSIAIIIKNTDFLTKRKCLFPYLNENKKVDNEDKSKILIELDTYLCEEGRDPGQCFLAAVFPCISCENRQETCSIWQESRRKMVRI